jgi:phosphoribosylanthranilate isomerase
MLKTKIKADSIVSLTDARYFAAWEVEWLGFNLDVDTPNGVTPATVNAIKSWVEGVKIVGEFGAQSVEEIQQTAVTLALDALQISHFSNVSTLKALQSWDILKEYVVEDLDELANLNLHLNELAPYVNHFILDFERNGITWNKIQPHLELLRSICEDYPIILRLPFDAAELPEILSSLTIQGLALSGGEEEKIGYKSFDDLDEIMEWLEED